MKNSISIFLLYHFQEINNEIEELTKQNNQLVNELTQLSNQLKVLQIYSNEREQFYSTEKIQYEKHITELSKRPLMNSIQLQTVNYLKFLQNNSFFFISRILLMMMIKKLNNYKMNLMIIN